MESQTQTPKYNHFLSQVHQPFFLLTMINALLVMLIFALNYKGILDLQIETLNFHIYTLIFMVFTNAFSGFLFTTLPKFCQTPFIDQKFYSKLFYVSSIGSVIFLAGAFINNFLMLAGMLILFISQIYTVLKLKEIFDIGLNKDVDACWILKAQYFGLFGHLLFLGVGLGLNVQNIAINISFYMYLIFLTFSVIQRMVPMFSNSTASKNEKFVNIVFVFFILKTVLSTFNNFTYIKIAEIFLDILLGIYLLGEFLRWKLPLFNSPAILWVLYLGLFWLPTAFFVNAFCLLLELIFDINFYFLSIHFMAIGFLTTILIGFGTRVILGHSGQIPQADKILTAVFWFIQIIVILRTLFSINVALNFDLYFLFDLSFGAWLILFLIWTGRYAKALVFERKY